MSDAVTRFYLDQLPEAQLKNNTLAVSVLKTDDVWFGMTYPEDKPFVAQSLKALHDAGVYPAALSK